MTNTPRRNALAFPATDQAPSGDHPTDVTPKTFADFLTNAPPGANWHVGDLVYHQNVQYNSGYR